MEVGWKMNYWKVSAHLKLFTLSLLSPSLRSPYSSTTIAYGINHKCDESIVSSVVVFFANASGMKFALFAS